MDECGGSEATMGSGGPTAHTGQVRGGAGVGEWVGVMCVCVCVDIG